MKPVNAYESNDGRLFRTAPEARRHDDAALVKPLLVELQKCLARGKESCGEEYGLLEFIRGNWSAIRVFGPKETA